MVGVVLMATVGGSGDAPSIPHERERALVEALRGLAGRATLADVVRASGLPRLQTEQDLRALLGLYRSHLAVDENGELLYLFDKTLARRIPEPGLETFMREAWRWTVKAGVLLVKLTIMVGLIFYTILFCILILVLAAKLFDGADADLDLGGGEGEGCATGALDAATFWHPGDVVYVASDWGNDAQGRRERKRKDRPAMLREPHALEPRYVTERFRRKRSKKKRFYEEIFAVVFGPQVEGPPALAEEREVLAWIHAHKGIITLTELVSRTGMVVAEAEQEMARLMSRYGGDVSVTEEGELLYTFHDLKVSAQQKGRLSAESKPAPPAWHRFEPDARLTGNSAGKDTFIGFMVACTLLSALLSPLALGPLGLPLAVPAVLLGGVFVVAPAVRLFMNSQENGRRYERNVRRAVLLAVYEAIGGRKALGREEALDRAAKVLVELQGQKSKEQQARLSEAHRTDLAKAFDALVAEFEAEVEVGEDGAQVFRFARQEASIRAAEEARAKATSAVELGEIVYSTDDENSDDVLAEQLEALEGEERGGKKRRAQADQEEEEEEVVEQGGRGRGKGRR
jgi:hypothetical protein